MSELNFENHTSHVSVQASYFGLQAFFEGDTDSNTDPELTVTVRQKGQEQ